MNRKLSDPNELSCVFCWRKNNKVSELENLVESKIYREDELETELEHCKSLLEKHSITTAAEPTRRISSLHANGTLSSEPLDSTGEGEEEEEGSSCEMCGDSGHDLDSCPECEFFFFPVNLRIEFLSTNPSERFSFSKKFWDQRPRNGDGLNSMTTYRVRTTFNILERLRPSSSKLQEEVEEDQLERAIGLNRNGVTIAKVRRTSLSISLHVAAFQRTDLDDSCFVLSR